MKNKFIKSTIILLIGGLLTKVLGMLIKIIIARIISPKTLGNYMLILPTFTLLISLSNFSFPLALSKLISEDKRNNKRLFFSILPVLIIINIILIILIVLLSPIISNKLLHNNNLYLSILSMSLVIPFTSISSICRSYFFGKQNMFPHVLSNIIEDIVRLIIIVVFLPIIKSKYIVCFLILINIISEVFSTLVLIFFLPKNIKIKKEDLYPNKSYIKDSLKICIPTTLSKLIGSIGYFLEPIILTNILIKTNNINYITTEYGIISGYVIPIILLPSFFTLALSQSILPVISKYSSINDYKSIKRKTNQVILLSLIIGIPVTIILLVKGDLFLHLIYHTNKGLNYLKILAPICLLQYLQSPLSSILDALNKSKDNLKITIIGTITRTISLLIFYKLGIYSLIISISLNILITTLYQIKKVRYYLTSYQDHFP